MGKNIKSARMNKSTISILVFLMLGLFSFLLPASIFAQSNGTVISSSPKTVRADEDFSVSLTSSDIDLDRAKITWYLNGKLGLEGIGKRGFSSRTGQVGTYFRIKAEIETPSGKIVTRNITVQPQEIDFLWRSNSYTPAFYEGRSLAPSAGFVVVTAMPNIADADGNILDPEDLIYTWRQRGITLGNASGYGQNTVVLENAQVPERLLQLSVSVSNRNNTVSATKSINIPLTEPRILFYEKHPLEGVLHSKILRNFEFEKDELVVKAEPYFFSVDDYRNDLLTYEWTISGRRVEEKELGENKSEIVFRREGTEGIAKIFLEIVNDNLPLRIMQQAERSFNIDIK